MLLTAPRCRHISLPSDARTPTPAASVNVITVRTPPTSATMDDAYRLVTQLFRRPDGLACHLVERHHPGTTTTGRDDHLVAVDKRRLTDQPLGTAATEVLEDVPLPDNAAVPTRRQARSPLSVST